MALHEFSWYAGEVASLVDRDAELRIVQAAIDRIAGIEYELPPSLQRLQWMRTFRTTAPFDAIRGATRALSGLEETLRIDPITVYKSLTGAYADDTNLARETANQWETALKWLMRRVAKRGSIFLPDLVRSALLYDEVCQQVMYLPAQIKAHSKLGGNSNRYQAALRRGPFAIINHNPKTVHARYSSYMAEAVVSVRCQTPQEIVDIWGDAASDISALMDDDKAPDSYLLVDYTDLDGRCVYALPGDDETVLGDVDDDTKDLIRIVEPTELDYPFIPWSCVVGGTNLESLPEKQRLPLLYPIYKSELFLNANISGSLMMSAGIAEFGSPGAARIGPNPDSMQVEYGEPGATVDVPPGHEYKKLPKDGLDPAQRELVQMHIEQINTTSVSRILVTGDPIAGEPYSAYNLRVKSAIGQILPFKQLAERAIEGDYELMLLWAHYTGDDISGYGLTNKDKGNQHRIQSEDIDPDCIYLGVKLNPDVPVERLQDINGAVQLQQLGASQSYVLQEVGVEDPEQMIEDKKREALANAVLQGYLKRIDFETSGQLQQMAQQLAQQMVQQMAEQQQAQAQQPPQIGPPGAPGMTPDQLGQFGQMANPDQNVGGGVPGAEGQGMNPAMGGNPAAMMNPAAAAMGAGAPA